MIHLNKKTHPAALKSPSKVSLVRSKSQDHLMITEKSVNRKNASDKSSGNILSITKNAGLSKSKSSKSLKKKQKSLVKNYDQTIAKKTKPKLKKSSESETKTVKKGKKLAKIKLFQKSFPQSQQSIQTQPLQYFLYHNTYIPIQNSAQRRFVFKIRQVHQLALTNTADTFYEKTDGSINRVMDVKVQQQIKKEINMQDGSVETEKKQIVECGTTMTPRNHNEICIQTQSLQFEENIQKCFSTTLNDLEFLFLPNQTNFQGFSKAQRLHYKELFESIALKIWTNAEDLEELTPEKIKILLYQRQCVQMGMIEFYPDQGFPTHILAVMSYLTNLFQYAQMNEKSEVLQKIHSIYGDRYQERLSRLLKGFPTNHKCSPILSQELFLSLENELFKDHEFTSQIVQKSVHIHNRVIFDAANQELEKFKPFYLSNGEPFPWSVNVGMTFFSIDEFSLGLLFKQIKQKIMMKFGFMCGILVDYFDFKELPNNQKHPLHIKKLEEQQLKMINEEVNEQKFQVQIQQTEVKLRMDLSNRILEDLIDKFCLDLIRLFH